MKKAWCCRDLEGEFTGAVYLFVGENPPAMSDDGRVVGPRGRWDIFGQKKTSTLTLAHCLEMLNFQS